MNLPDSGYNNIGSSDLIEREISKESINIEKRKAEIINVSDKTIESINVKQQQKRTSCPKLLEQKSFEEKTECIKIENAQNKSIQNQIMDSAPSDNSILLEKHESEAKIYHIDREKSILKEQSDCKTGLERNENKLNQIDREKSLVKKQLSSENLKLIDTNVFLKDSLENSYHINENNILKPEMKAENSEIDSNFINEEKPVEILKQQYQFELNSDLELSKELSEPSEEQIKTFDSKKENDQISLKNQAEDIQHDDTDKTKYEEINTSENEFKPQISGTEQELNILLNEKKNDEDLKLAQQTENNGLK